MNYLKQVMLKDQGKNQNVFVTGGTRLIYMDLKNSLLCIILISAISTRLPR
jgi:hypothetical protein